MPCLIRYSAAVRHDHTFLKEVHRLPKDSIITFDKGYVDYAQYEKFTLASIWYVTRLKDNAIYEARLEYDIPDEADSGENAIEIQIWTVMLANLLITLVKSKIKRKRAFSNMVSLIRQQLMN